MAKEKGYNTYKKVADSKCQAAIDWWKENDVIWANVRANWDYVFAQKQNIQLKSKVDGKRLYQHLFSMEPASTRETEIKEVITSFVER